MGTEHITYRHFGSETFHPEYFGKIVNDPSRSKPYGGLWASRVDASHGWEEFCRCAHYQTKSLRKHFDFCDSAGCERVYDPLDEGPYCSSDA